MGVKHCLTRWAFSFFSLILAGCSATAPSRPIVIQGATLIDGTGRAALTDSLVVMQGGRFQAVGKRGEVSIPSGAEVIDAKGKTLLPGLIDGHCHYRDWMGELYLAYGVVTCPNISNNPVEWITAQRDAVKNGSVRGPRVWASANIIDGPPPGGTGTLRRQRTSIIVDSEDEAHKAVRSLAEKGVDGIKLFERLKPNVAKAAADEAHRLGRPVFGHSLDIFTAATNGYQSVEHSWSVVYTSIQDPKKKHDLDIGRMLGKVDTPEVHAQMEPAIFDKIIKAMVGKNVHWSPPAPFAPPLHVVRVRDLLHHDQASVGIRQWPRRRRIGSFGAVDVDVNRSPIAIVVAPLCAAFRFALPQRQWKDRLARVARDASFDVLRAAA